MSEKSFFVSMARGRIVKLNCFNGLKLGEFAFKWLQKFTGVPGKKSIFFCFNFTRRILRYNKTFLRVSE